MNLWIPYLLPIFIKNSIIVIFFNQKNDGLLDLLIRFAPYKTQMMTNNTWNSFYFYFYFSNKRWGFVCVILTKINNKGLEKFRGFFFETNLKMKCV